MPPCSLTKHPAASAAGNLPPSCLGAARLWMAASRRPGCCGTCALPELFSLCLCSLSALALHAELPLQLLHVGLSLGLHRLELLVIPAGTSRPLIFL